MPKIPLDETTELRPQIGGRRGKIPIERVPTFRSSLLRRLGRTTRSNERTGNRSQGIRRAADVRVPGARSRRCIVKARYFAMNANARKAARLHMAYIERDGVERDGSAGRLYGPDEAFDRTSVTSDLDAEKRQFRLIVSPEDGADLDLTAYTRQLMATVEGDLGRKLIWAAVNHHDTDNPHVHVVIRGIDAAGRELRIDGQYISQELRWRAQEIVTRELGPMSEVELAQQRATDVTRERLTSIDRVLAPYVTPEGTVSVANLSLVPQPYRESCLARIQILERLQLARKCSRGKWLLAPGWKESLTQLGQRGDVIKRIYQGMHGRPVGRYQQVDSVQPFEPFEGVLRAKGLHDELAGTFFAVVETQAGVAKYIPLPAGVVDALREGDIVRVGAEAESWTKATDRILVRHAAQHDGVYDPALHLGQLEGLAAQDKPRATPSPAELITANTRRLERLEKYGLVIRLRDGRWKIPSDLLDSLAQRASTHPRGRIKVDTLAPALETQPNYPGPTWLDGQPSVASTRAPFGFGAEVSEAARRRDVHVRRMGIDPLGPDRQNALNDVERETFGRQLAETLGMVYDPKPPRIAGRLMTCDRMPSGSSYVRVVDEGARRFTLLPSPPGSQRFEGQLVDVALDQQGRATLHTARISREK